MITHIEVVDNNGNKYNNIRSTKELQNVFTMLTSRGLSAVQIIAQTTDGYEVMRQQSEYSHEYS